MKALLRKDVYTLRRQLRFMLLLYVFFAVIPNAFQNVFAVLYAALLPYTALSYDEYSRWDVLAAMMPYSRRELVLSKYVLGWLSGVGAFAFCAAAQAVMALFTHTAPQLGLVFLALCASALVMEISLPFLFRFGVQKGKIASFLIMGLVLGTAAGVSSGVVMSVVYGGEEIGLWLCAAAAGLAAAAAPLSVRISVRMYEKRTA